jgi:AbrB family looped-hinge helix DNA binding protein
MQLFWIRGLCVHLLRVCKVNHTLKYENQRVTIPKEIRDQFGLRPETEVEFHVVGGPIVLKKAPKKLNLAKWKGRCGNSSRSSVTPL